MNSLQRLPFLLLTLMVAILVMATLLEHHSGTATAQQYIYHTWAFRALWGSIALLGAWQLRHLRSRPAPLLLHLGFGIVLLGALATALTSQEATLHLRKGEATTLAQNNDGSPLQLPFTIALRDFRIHHYPGTQTPRDYESLLLIDQKPISVSMNNIATHQGYRIYQSSYDTDRAGSLLTLNYDPWGTPITYTGYSLLLIAMLWLLLHPQEGFRRLLRHPTLHTLLLLLSTTTATASPNSRPNTTALPAVARAQADSFARTQIVYNGRIAPFNTLARDFATKITGKASFRGLSPEQLLLSLLLYPQEWEQVPLISIPNAALRQQLGINTQHAAIAQLYQGQNYRLQQLLQNTPAHSPQYTAIQEVDEKVALLLMLHQGTLIQRIPPQQAHARISPWRIELEILYNRLQPQRWSFILLLTLGLLAFATQILRPRWPWLPTLQKSLLWTTTLLLATLLGLRWIIAAHPPMSNGPQTMLLLALSALLLALLFHRRQPMLPTFGWLIAGFALLVAHLSDQHPQITSLMPVLASPLLSLHVTIIMMSYAIFALLALNSAHALWLHHRERRKSPLPTAPLTLPQNHSPNSTQATLLNRLLLYPAVFLLTAGIFIGAIWANQSWGRYWAWDPKEVWALITLLLYALPLHPQSLPPFRKNHLLNLYLLLAFLSVIITYFGVNFFLGGRHAYV